MRQYIRLLNTKANCLLIMLKTNKMKNRKTENPISSNAKFMISCLSEKEIAFPETAFSMTWIISDSREGL